jgi:hypothetical protein
MPDLYQYQQTAISLFQVGRDMPEWQPYLLIRLFHEHLSLPPELEKMRFPYLKNKQALRHSFLLSLIHGPHLSHPWHLLLYHQLLSVALFFLTLWYGRNHWWLIPALLEPFSWFWSASWLKESLIFPLYAMIWVSFLTPIPFPWLVFAFLIGFWIRPTASLFLFICYLFAHLTRKTKLYFTLSLFFLLGIGFSTTPFLKHYLQALELNYYYSYHVITEEPGVEPIRGEYAYWCGDIDLSTWKGVLKALPLGLYNGFLNPLFPKLPMDSWKDLAAIGIILRNVFTLLLFFTALYCCIRYKTCQLSEARVGIWLILYALGIGLGIGLSHTHVGAILRYQVSYLPALWIGCISLLPSPVKASLRDRLIRLFHRLDSSGKS